MGQTFSDMQRDFYAEKAARTSDADVARELGISPRTVAKWRSDRNLKKTRASTVTSRPVPPTAAATVGQVPASQASRITEYGDAALKNPLPGGHHDLQLRWLPLNRDDNHLGEQVLECSNNVDRKDWFNPVVGYEHPAPAWFDNYLRLADEEIHHDGKAKWNSTRRWLPMPRRLLNHLEELYGHAVYQRKQNLRDLVFALGNYCDNRVYSLSQWEKRAPNDDQPALVVYPDDPFESTFKVAVVTKSPKKTDSNEHPTIVFRVPTVPETVSGWLRENWDKDMITEITNNESMIELWEQAWSNISDFSNYDPPVVNKDQVLIKEQILEEEHRFMETMVAGFEKNKLSEPIKIIAESMNYYDDSDLGQTDEYDTNDEME